MGHSCGRKLRGAYSLVTVSMSIDFISSAEIGQWLTVETDVIKTGSTLCFAQCFVKADGVAIARANATFRVGPKKG
jgi:acyl-coenzyme A thioesterase PaaI-like protein